MSTLRVNLKQIVDNSYDIKIGKDLFEDFISGLKENPIAYSYVIVTDSNVRKLYGEKLKRLIDGIAEKTLLIDFPAGEMQKTREIKTEIEDRMLEAGFGRDSALIALGGGVVGDIAGYVAATYTRGIPYIQVPTTLVACVDSSIGGKTAVDTPHGKNLIGSFYQPEAVIIDIKTLTTLGPEEIREGLAEIIKYGIIADYELFELIEQKSEDIFNYNIELLSLIVEKCCRIKGDVVENDEKESNLRKILNFGHTIGHAIENHSNYTLTHGNSISIGMVLEGRIAVNLGIWSAEDLERVRLVFIAAGLPVEIPFDIDPEKLISSMKIDKKSRAGVIEMSLPEAIGKIYSIDGKYSLKIDDETIREVF